MFEDLHPEQWAPAFVRVVRKRLTIIAIFLVLLSLAGAPDAVKEVAQGQVSISGATASVAHGLSLVLDNGYVRLFLLAYGLYLLARGSHRVIKADEARSEDERRNRSEIEAARASGVEEAEQRLEQAVAKINERLEQIFEEALVVPRLLERQGRLRQRVEQIKEILTRASNTLDAYRQALNEVRAGRGMGASNACIHIRQGLRETMRVLAEAGTAMGQPAELPPVEDPEPIYREPTEENGLRFLRDENKDFIDAHDNNARLLQNEIYRLDSVLAAQNGEHDRLEQQIATHLAKYNR